MRTLPSPPSSLTVVRPDDRPYRFLRSTYTTHRAPSMILLPTSPDEVAQAVEYAAGLDVPFSVRSGGHGLSGTSSNNGGVVVDLSALDTVDVLDPDTGLVRVGAGARWAEVAAALASNELAISSGDHGNVGVGGLATAGGIGWLARSYGLTVDHVRAATVVLPSGDIMRADESHPDLLWAVRGAGSFVGLVVDFDIDAARVPGLQVGQMAVTVDDVGEALVRWTDAVRRTPRALSMAGMLARQGDDLVLASTVVVADPDPAAAAAAVDEFRTALPGRVFTGRLTPAPYRALVPRSHLHPNLGQQPAVTTNVVVDEVTPAAARDLVALARHRIGPLIQIRTLGGAIDDVPAAATAYAHRGADLLITATTFDVGGTGELGRAVAPLRAHGPGSYQNFESTLSPEVFDRSFPGATGTRVRELARRYDPDGLLRRAWGL